MWEIVQFLALIFSLVASGSWLASVLFHKGTETLEDLKIRRRDAQIAFGITFIFLSVIGSLLTIQIVQNNKLIEKQKDLLKENSDYIKKEQNDNNYLNQQNEKLSKINTELQTKSDSYLQLYFETQMSLQNSIDTRNQISEDIQEHLMTCVEDMAELIKITDNSKEIIKKAKEQLGQSTQDSLGFSKEQILCYTNTLEILENNTNNTRHVIQGMAYNLYFIMARASVSTPKIRIG